MEYIEQYWRAGIEILILWICIYQLYRAFRATKGALIFIGVVMILAAVTALAYGLNLKVIAWILLRSAVGIAFALVIVFQTELRQALARLGGRFFSFSNVQKLEFAEGLTDAVLQLSRKRIGALIALEREISLKEYSENGVRVDAEFSPELVMTIFYPMTALHDGGVILSKNRIDSAGCVFPLSKNEMSDRTLGLRHRASVGLSEETDCVCIVVSEETGNISIAMNGVLDRNLKGDEFKEKLEKIFVPEEEEEDENEEEKRKALDSEDSSLDTSSSDLVSHK